MKTETEERNLIPERQGNTLDCHHIKENSFWRVGETRHLAGRPSTKKRSERKNQKTNYFRLVESKAKTVMRRKGMSR